MAALLKTGRTVLLPIGENQRYDLVIDTDAGFQRVQCKTGRLKNGAVVFDTSSNSAHRGTGRKSYRGEVEFFGVHCPELDAVYLVPVEEVGAVGGQLRVEPAKNGQKSGVKLAEKYVVG